MSSAVSAALICAVFVLSLWFIARWGEGAASGKGVVFSPRSWLSWFTYALTFPIYHTSWSYFGTVGEALRHGLTFITLYTGPALLLVFGQPLLHKIIVVTKRQKATSIADFIACRYGKSQWIALLVTLVLLPSVLLYLSIQLSAAGDAFDYFGCCLDYRDAKPAMACATFDKFREGSRSGGGKFFWSAVIALSMALFACLFGVKRINSSAHHGGLMLAVAFESLIKAAALVFVTLAILSATLTNSLHPENVVGGATTITDPSHWLSITLVSFLAFICLPHMYHVIAVEYPDKSDHANTDMIGKAAWIYLAYLVILIFCILLISGIGRVEPGDEPPKVDFRLLELALMVKADWPAYLTVTGAFAAATGMMIVSSVSMATMICNVIVMPLIGWRKRRIATGERSRGDPAAPVRAASGSNERLLRAIRWCAIFTVYAAALGLSRIEFGVGIANMGLISFVIVAQLGPALIFGLYWLPAHRFGAMAGVLGGLAVFGAELLFSRASPINSPAHDMSIWIASASLSSLMVNALAFGIVSLIASGGQNRGEDGSGDARLDLDRIQAEAVVHGELRSSNEAGVAPCGRIKVRHVSAFLADFSENASKQFERFLHAQREAQRDPAGNRVADSDILNELHDRVAEIRGPIRALPYISANLGRYLDKDGNTALSPEKVQEGLILSLNSRLAKRRGSADAGNTVFIIHGHDKDALRHVTDYMEELKLDKVVMQDLANNGREVLEKFEDCSNVGYAIAIMTPDDVGNLNGGRPTARARQNVILEIGYFIAKLSKRNVCLITRGEIETPSDLAGLLPLAIDLQSHNWRRKLWNELLAAGMVFPSDDDNDGDPAA